jgi:Flp pilus assembly protein TadD
MPARLALTQLALRRGDSEQALKLAQDTLKMNPSSGVSTLLEAAAYLRKGDFDEARNLLEKILKANPNQADSLLEMAVLNLVQKRYKEAEDYFRKAYAVDPSNLRGLMGVAEIHFQQKQFDQAIKVIADEYQKQPQRADLRKELANMEYRCQQYDKSIADYQAILDRYKDSPIEQADIYGRIAQTDTAKGDLQKGIENLSKARQLVPGSATYISELAELYDLSGHPSEALSAYREAMKLDPNNAVVLNNLAYLMSQNGQNLDEALTLAQHAKQQLPNFYEVSDTIGWIYIKKNLADSAIEIFKDLTTKVNDNPTFHYHYGMALYQKGDKANALKELRAALQHKPKKSEEDQIKELVQKLS